MTTENKQRVIEFLNSELPTLNIDFNYHLKDADFDTADEVQDILQDAGAFDIEIIYYGTAMDYLRENDPSLKYSLELAQDMGFEPKNLNSEVLASLLASDNARSEFSGIMQELESLIDEINEEEATEAEEEESKEENE